jgi:hypothetical protein
MSYLLLGTDASLNGGGTADVDAGQRYSTPLYDQLKGGLKGSALFIELARVMK